MSNVTNIIDAALERAHAKVASAGTARSVPGATLADQAREVAQALEFVSLKVADDGSYQGRHRRGMLEEFFADKTAAYRPAESVAPTGQQSTPPHGGKTRLSPGVSDHGQPAESVAPTGTQTTLDQTSGKTSLYDLITHKNENSNVGMLESNEGPVRMTKRQAQSQVRARLKRLLEHASDVSASQAAARSAFPQAYAGAGGIKEAGGIKGFLERGRNMATRGGELLSGSKANRLASETAQMAAQMPARPTIAPSLSFLERTFWPRKSTLQALEDHAADLEKVRAHIGKVRAHTQAFLEEREKVHDARILAGSGLVAAGLGTTAAAGAAAGAAGYGLARLHDRFGRLPPSYDYGEPKEAGFLQSGRNALIRGGELLSGSKARALDKAVVDHMASRPVRGLFERAVGQPLKHEDVTSLKKWHDRLTSAGEAAAAEHSAVQNARIVGALGAGALGAGALGAGALGAGAVGLGAGAVGFGAGAGAGYGARALRDKGAHPRRASVGDDYIKSPGMGV